jgi:phosphoribosylamine-glycine ligase
VKRQPSINGMKSEGFPFVGCLFTGFMLTADGPRLLEYNVRFGDPESQSCLPLLESDLAELMLACCDGTLASQTLEVSSQSACTVVVAAGGYPSSYAKGTAMDVKTPDEEGVFIFHAGTGLSTEGELKTSGGRVIASTATGGTLHEAVDRAYKGVEAIKFEGRPFVPARTIPNENVQQFRAP